MSPEQVSYRKTAADWLRKLAAQIEAEPYCNATINQEYITGAAYINPDDQMLKHGPIIGMQYTISFALKEVIKPDFHRPDRVRNW